MAMTDVTQYSEPHQLIDPRLKLRLLEGHRWLQGRLPGHTIQISRQQVPHSDPVVEQAGVELIPTADVLGGSLVVDSS